MNNLANNIRILRKKIGVSQAELGLTLGKGDTAVSSWERGNSEPGISDLIALCNIFAISADKLLFANLSDVQVMNSLEYPNNNQNVQGNVQASVQVKDKNRAELSEDKRLENQNAATLREALKTNEILGIAIRGLEQANSVLIARLEDVEEENKRLKKGVSSVGGGLENPQKRAAG